ncbi:Transposable element Tcb1 transposase [Paramuricea clavata]|uniref:Transposable element Tcb1 transposase n=1 Tax=Paramuricea clavata TaxID=317549 RepID=A0A7D9ENJ6_PARCT|nr:Transposable element Tcb1 transposase [Paramuricea clavata]
MSLSIWMQYHLYTRTTLIRQQFNRNRECGERKVKGLPSLRKAAKLWQVGDAFMFLQPSLGVKGIILSQVYDKMNGDFLAEFIQNNFNLCFGKAGPKTGRKRLLVMDNDPCQTSKKAMLALTQIECDLHRIPPRSPDINPIENMFHLVKKNTA